MSCLTARTESLDNHHLTNSPYRCARPRQSSSLLFVLFAHKASAFPVLVDHVTPAGTASRRLDDREFCDSIGQCTTYGDNIHNKKCNKDQYTKDSVPYNYIGDSNDFTTCLDMCSKYAFKHYPENNGFCCSRGMEGHDTGRCTIGSYENKRYSI